MRAKTPKVTRLLTIELISVNCRDRLAVQDHDDFTSAQRGRGTKRRASAIVALRSGRPQRILTKCTWRG